MSKWYPCIYCTEELKCEKFSVDGVVSYCVLGPCSDEKPSNADRIRSMSDEELAEWYYENANCPPERGYPDCGVTPYNNGGNCKKCWLDWLKQEVKE